jgi:Tfp pilus assembly protein PilN
MGAPINIIMNSEIDFLPASYRESGIQRKNITLRVGVVIAFVTLIGFAAIYQQRIRLLANQQLADLLPSYQRAQQETTRLAQLQQLLQKEDKLADLCIYLRHPWPRSQILAALVKPLPDEVQLRELSIQREPLPAADLGPSRSERPGEAALAKTDPNEHDLQALREQWDKTRIVVKLSGVTDDALALHRYFGQLDRAQIFVKVDVGAIEQIAGASDRSIQFSARVFVRPGYGQPDGPTPVAEAPTPKSPAAGFSG